MSTPEERAIERNAQIRLARERDQKHEQMLRRDKADKVLRAWRKYFAEERERDYPHASLTTFMCCIAKHESHQPCEFTSPRIGYGFSYHVPYSGDVSFNCILPEEVMAEGIQGSTVCFSASPLTLSDYLLYHPESTPPVWKK